MLSKTSTSPESMGAFNICGVFSSRDVQGANHCRRQQGLVQRGLCTQWVLSTLLPPPSSAEPHLKVFSYARTPAQQGPSQGRGRFPGMGKQGHARNERVAAAGQHHLGDAQGASHEMFMLICLGKTDYRNLLFIATKLKDFLTTGCKNPLNEAPQLSRALGRALALSPPSPLEVLFLSSVSCQESLQLCSWI